MGIVDFLVSDRARRVLSEFHARPFDPIRDVPALRKHFSTEEASALAEMMAGRSLARSKFGDWADQMVYTLEAVQQATPRQVAEHRAKRFQGRALVADLGCGIGGDAMALDGQVLGLDVDMERVAMSVHNVAMAGGRLSGVRADLSTLPPFGADAGFADPARRDPSGRRVFDVERYRPPLSLLMERWAPLYGAFAMKVHPGVAHDQIPEVAEAEFVSLDGDMREACLWIGDFRSTEHTRATVLPSGQSLAGTPLSVAPTEGAVGAWLFEPDPAVLRAGLVGDLAVMFGLTALDRTIAYLSGPDPIDSPFLEGFEIEDLLPFNGKRIRSYLRQRNVGQVTVKKRGTAVDPDSFRRGLKLSGTEHRVVVLTRSRGRPVAVICVSGG